MRKPPKSGASCVGFSTRESSRLSLHVQIEVGGQRNMVRTAHVRERARVDQPYAAIEDMIEHLIEMSPLRRRDRRARQAGVAHRLLQQVPTGLIPGVEVAGD